jgi:hypothetical protein
MKRIGPEVLLLDYTDWGEVSGKGTGAASLPRFAVG